MSKALTASVVIGAALSASYNNVFKTAKQKQYELGKAFADTNKKLKASDAVVEYRHKLTALKRKYAEAGGGNRRMAAGIADLEKRYRAAKRELKSYGFAVGDAVKAQKRLAKESKKLSQALESGATLERNKALRQELHARALPVLGAAYGVGRALGGAMAVEQQEIRLQTVINADDGDTRAAVRRAREHAINVARASLASQSEILDIQYALNSAGLSEQASRVGSEIVSKVATVTHGMPEQVAEIIGTTFNNMGDAVVGANVDEKLGRIGDVLTKIQFKYPLRDFGQLGESMKEAAAQASLSKVGLEETAVALGLLNSAGLDGGKGGTALSATLRQMKKAADELGFSIVRGADGQMDFVATLNNVNSTLLPAVNALLAPLAGLLGVAASLAHEFPVLGAVLGGVTAGIIGFTAIAFTARYAGTLFVDAWALARKTLRLFSVAALSANLSLAKQKALALGSALAAAALATKTAAVTAAQWAWNVALNANPIGLVVGAVAALAGAAWLIYDHWQPIMEWLQDKFAWVGDAIGWVGDKWRALFGDDKQAEVTVIERTRRAGGGRSRAPVAADIDEVMRAQAASRPAVTQKVTYEGAQITVHAAPA